MAAVESEIVVTETTEVIMPRDRSESGKKMAEIMKDIVDLVPDTELEALLGMTLNWMKDNEYNLQDTPENLIAKLRSSGE